MVVAGTTAWTSSQSLAQMEENQKKSLHADLSNFTKVKEIGQPMDILCLNCGEPYDAWELCTKHLTQLEEEGFQFAVDHGIKITLLPVACPCCLGKTAARRNDPIMKNYRAAAIAIHTILGNDRDGMVSALNEQIKE